MRIQEKKRLLAFQFLSTTERSKPEGVGLPWASAASKQNADSDVGGTQKKVCEKERIIGTECPYNKRILSAYTIVTLRFASLSLGTGWLLADKTYFFQ